MSNLYKTSYMNMGSDKRVIDMNELVKKRIDALGYKMQRPENSGFVEGINADSVGVEELVEGVTLESDLFPEGEAGGDFTEGLSGNVIKGDSHADTQALLDAAHMEAEKIIDTAKASAAKIESDASAKANSIMEEARNQGYESGYSEGMSKAAQEMQDMREALDKEKQELEELYQKRLNDMEPELVETITDVYEHILKTDLKIHKTIAGHLVANALRNIEGARSFFIHISKDNFDSVHSRKGVLEEAVKVPGSIIEIMEDISLPPDSCMIETDGGIFDCSLGTELSELSTKLRMLSFSKDDPKD